MWSPQVELLVEYINALRKCLVFRQEVDNKFLFILRSTAWKLIAPQVIGVAADVGASTSSWDLTMVLTPLATLPTNSKNSRNRRLRLRTYAMIKREWLFAMTN